ncbi:EndoU domain-containing protein [uncultured Gardnerella sp.]|uniref:EndoU domain-containing protein n=1 Tax=uncultured Gardnerella sp. TaxID=293424 RepID=UPI0025E5C7F1|nr:EndoU domain-containing protein [uncultured Gardnerella sp.]
MGTTKSGRVLNTRGAAGSASQFAVVHSNEGAYTKPHKGQQIRLKSGGHGQTGLKELDKYGIEYHIVKTYPNGVRVGYVPDHKDRSKQEGINQSWFPENWMAKDIKRAGEHVAKLKQNRHKGDGIKLYGIWKGVRVVVICTHGQIGTIFPDSKQPLKKKGNK